MGFGSFVDINIFVMKTVPVQTSDGTNLRLTNVGPGQTSDKYKCRSGANVRPV